MTPKEKAEELINRFLKYVDWNDLIGDSTNRDWVIRNAKQCALICIDEILNSTPAKSPISSSIDFMPHFKAIKYWEQVKEEINKL